MKNAKRILVAFALVVVMAVTAVIGLAADATTSDYTEILKYYDPLYSTILVDEDFSGSGFAGGVCVNANDTVSNKIGVDDDGSNDYLSIVAGSIANSAAIGDMLYYYNFDQASGLFILDFSIYADHKDGTLVKCTGTCKQANVYYGTAAPGDTVCAGCGGELSVKKTVAPTVSIYLDSTAHGADSKAGIPFVTFDFEAGTVEYYAASTYTKLNIAVTEDTWYKVHFIFAKNTFTVSVTDATNSANTATTEAIGTPSVFDAASFKIGYTAANDNRDTTVRIDDIYLQLGDSYRNITSDERYTLTKNALSDIKKLLDNSSVDLATKLDAIAVYDELCAKYGLRTLIKNDAATLDVANAIVNKSIEIYADLLKEGVDAINPLATYSERLAHIEAYAEYAAKLEANLNETVSDEINDIFDAYDAEKTKLENDEKNTLAYLELYNTIIGEGKSFTNEDYLVTKNIYDRVRKAFYSKGTYTFNATYPGAYNAVNEFYICRDRYESSSVKAEMFVDSVDDLLDAAGDEEEELIAYLAARSNLFKNTTYPGVAEQLSKYNKVDDRLGPICEYAEEFIAIIDEASASLNLGYKTSLLDTAATMIDTVNEYYPGITAAKKEYQELCTYIQNSIAAAEAYINAVNALEGLEGVALRTAVENALRLKEAGNIPEIDGVADANIALDNAKSAIDVVDSYGNKFIQLVNMIDEEATLAERYAAIRLAQKAEADADNVVTGVSAAKTKLATLINNYNNDVESVNSSFAAVNSTASEFACSVSSADGILAKALALISAIFA